MFGYCFTLEILALLAVCDFSSRCALLKDSLDKMLADAYVWSDAEDPNLYGEWDFEVRRLVSCSPGMLTLCDYSDSLIPTLDPREFYL